MKFKYALNEEVSTNIEKETNVLEKKIKQIFPKSYVSITYSDHFSKTIDGRIALGKDKSEWDYGYFENDPLNIQFIVHFNNDGTFDLKWLRYALKLKPTEDYLALSIVRLKPNPLKDKNKLSESDLFKTIENQIKNVPAIIMKNKDKILDSHKELFKSKGY